MCSGCGAVCSLGWRDEMFTGNVRQDTSSAQPSPASPLALMAKHLSVKFDGAGNCGVDWAGLVGTRHTDRWLLSSGGVAAAAAAAAVVDSGPGSGPWTQGSAQ